MSEVQNILKRSLVELRDLRARLQEAERVRTEPIAIVGIGCRLPGGVNDPENYWQLLSSGVDGTRDIPADRWDVDAFYDPDPNAPGKMYVRRGGFLDKIANFDPQFFNIPPREVQSMDPQHRLALEVAWEALENAGIAPDQLANTATGVFIGITSYDYAQHILQTTDLSALDAYVSTGNPLNFSAGRISYLLGLQGPSIALDTACSSSLVSVHLACNSLRLGESQVALAGGVNVMMMPETMVTLAKAKMLAADGRCKTFDASADGYGRGEGCGMLVLKRLSDALANGDNIWAVIRGSAVNQDGPSSGLTVPNGQAQQQLIQTALKNARIDAKEIAYVEAHGTGTSLGDPIELRALNAVLGQERRSDQPLIVGSVKTNLGHLEAAAGVAGIIKVALSLHHSQIPPHLNLKTPNPNVNWESLNLRIPHALESFPKYGEKRFAAISGFGVSGTNAHIIIEAAPKIISQPSAVERSAHILTISAPHAESLPELAQSYAQKIDSQPENLADIAYSANTGRAQFPHRAAFIADSKSNLRDQLKDFAASGTTALIGEVRPGQHPQIAWLFTGQGAQVSGMAQTLYETQPIFRAALDSCTEILKPHLEHGLLDVLFNPDLSAELDQTMYTQPALFAIEYALAQLWMSWNVQPAAVIGHSVGEYVAACIAGVFSLEDGLNLIATRGRLMQKLPLNGRMAAVFADAATVENAIQSYAATVSIGAYNGPQMTVISGLDTDIQRLIDDFVAQGITAQDLRVSHAFHSPLMQPILDEFAAVAHKIQYYTPRIPIISNVSGTAAKELNTDYWVQHIRQPVRFQQGMQALYDAGSRVFLEIGPKPTLSGMGKRILTDSGVHWLASLDSRDDWETMLNSLSALYTLGVPVNWKAFEAPYTRRKQRLPNTPYQRQHYWIGDGNSITPRRAAMQPQTGGHPLLGQRLKSPLIQYETELSPQSTTLIDQHIIYGNRVLPGIVWIEMGMAAHGGMDEASTFSLEKFTLRQPIIFSDDAHYTAQIVVTADHVDIYSQYGDDWHLNAGMELHVNPALPAHTDSYSAEAIQKRATQDYSAEYFYSQIWHPDFHLGESFRCVEHIWRRDGEALARMHMPLHTAGTNVRPELLLLDACVQVIIAAMPPESEKGDVYIGFGQEYTRIYRPFGESETVWCQAVLQSENLDSGTITGSLYIFDDNGALIGELSNVAYRRVSREALAQSERVAPHRTIKPVSKISRAALTAIPSAQHPAALRTYLSELVGQVTGMGAAKIDPQRSLLDMVDSLMSVELKTHIERDLQVNIPLSEILGGQSINDIVNALLLQLSDSLPAEALDDGMSIVEMQALAVLPPDIQPETSDWSNRQPESILLTGATGFVGAFLLAELLTQTSADIYCLVRAETEEIAHQRLRENLDFYRLWQESYRERIKPVPGDLAQPRLGINEKIFEWLAQKVDLIWHCGAAVKWTYPYAALAPANVEGTIEILRLATLGKTKPLHHVSTVGVFSSRAFDGQTITESTPLDTGGALYTGYAQTKWVSEALVREAAARGLPVNIYRINTSGDSRTGIYNPHDYLPLLLKGCIELGSAPDDLDLIVQGAPVDFAAAAMVYLSFQPNRINQTYHIVNPEGMTWQQVVAVLRESGQLLHTMSYQEWQAQVQTQSQQDSQFALAGLSALFTEAFPSQTHLPLFDNHNVIEALKETNLACPPFDNALLQHYLAHFQAVTR
jgi:thioester reductase-like protein